MPQHVSDAGQSRPLWLTIALPTAFALLLLDQLSKFTIVHLVGLESRATIPLLPFLNLTWVENTGTAMGVIRIGGPVGYVLLICLLVIISAGLLWMIVRSRSRFEALALGLVMGGALGNILDRVRLGYVIDFVHLHVGGWNFYVFNIADTAISIGVILLFAASFQSADRGKSGSKAA